MKTNEFNRQIRMLILYVIALFVGVTIMLAGLISGTDVIMYYGMGVIHITAIIVWFNSWNMKH
jgi:uncharacterized membrane protein